MCAAGVLAAAAGPGGPELRLLCLHGLPAPSRRLMPALWCHLSHHGFRVLKGERHAPVDLAMLSEIKSCVPLTNHNLVPRIKSSGMSESVHIEGQWSTGA